MARRYKTTFVQSDDQVPEGYVPMRSLVVDSTAYKAVARAQKSGIVRAVKLVRHEGDLTHGAVWVHKADCDLYLSGLDAKEVIPPDRSLDAECQGWQAVADRLKSLERIEASLSLVCQSLTKLVESLS
jgi:hypothetical protein